MSWTTKLTPYDEQIFNEFDEDQSISASIAYRSTQPVATNYGLPAEDPVPLFLSNDIEQFGQRSFGRVRERSTISSIILKISSMAAVAAAAAFAIMTVGNPLPLFTNAKASLIGVSAAQSNPVQSTPVQLANPAQPAPAIQSTVDVAQAAPGIAPSAPTREEIAAAFIAAHQNQAETRPPAAVVAPPPPARQVAARQLDADELETLLKRARALIEIGDIAPARLLLERAADAQQAGAALLLAQTYDPTVLGTPDMRSITPDPAMAREWYQKAARLGSRDAQTRLAQMQN
jgi:hypothetical protein